MEEHQTFYLFRKDGNAYLSPMNTDLMRLQFCKNPERLSGVEALLRYGFDIVEQSFEKCIAKVPCNDGKIILHVPSSEAGYEIKKAMEAIGLSFITIFKADDSTPIVFTEKASWRGNHNVSAFLHQFT